jgi:hypothetical protein
MKNKSLTLWLGAAFLLGTLPVCRAADIYGKITFSGKPPPEVPIPQLKSDASCGQFHKEMPTTHFYVVGPEGGLGDVVLSLKGVHAKASNEKLAPQVIDQKGCEYEPYVSACHTGQEIIVKNSDPVLHNVHVMPTVAGNKEQNQAQMPHGPDLKFSFGAPEQFLKFKCDVHPWMFAYVSVFDNPWFAVSAKDGTYRIHNVPPGHYVMEATHRKLGAREQSIDVKDTDVNVNFSFGTKAGGLAHNTHPGGSS